MVFDNVECDIDGILVFGTEYDLDDLRKRGFLGSVVKNLTANAGDVGSNPGSERFPRRRAWQPTPVFLPGESHGWRGLYPMGSQKSQT